MSPGVDATRTEAIPVRQTRTCSKRRSQMCEQEQEVVRLSDDQPAAASADPGTETRDDGSRRQRDGR